MKLAKIHRPELLDDIKHGALKILADQGVNYFGKDNLGIVRIAVDEPVGFLYYTPFSFRVNPPRKYGLEIWCFDERKVFSYWWFPPFLKVFQPGDWVEHVILRIGRNVEMDE